MPDLTPRTLADAISLSDDCRIITMVDHPYRIIHTNKAWSELTKFTFADVVNDTCKVLQGKITESLELAKLHRALEERREEKVRLLNFRKGEDGKEGESFINELHVVPLQNSAGEPTHFLGILKSTDQPAESALSPREYTTAPACVVEQPSITTALHKDEETTLEADTEEAGRPAKRARGADGGGPDGGPSSDNEPSNITNDPSRPSLEMAMQEVDAAVVITEASRPFRILHANKSWEHTCGYSYEEAEGKTCGLLQGEATDKETLASLMQKVAQQEEATVTLQNYRKGGKQFTNRLEVTPLQDATGRTVAFQAVVNDLGTGSSMISG